VVYTYMDSFQRWLGRVFGGVVNASDAGAEPAGAPVAAD
jgi:hypothetical protein